VVEVDVVLVEVVAVVVVEVVVDVVELEVDVVAVAVVVVEDTGCGAAAVGLTTNQTLAIPCPKVSPGNWSLM